MRVSIFKLILTEFRNCVVRWNWSQDLASAQPQSFANSIRVVLSNNHFDDGLGVGGNHLFAFVSDTVGHFVADRVKKVFNFLFIGSVIEHGKQIFHSHFTESARVGVAPGDLEFRTGQAGLLQEDVMGAEAEAGADLFGIDVVDQELDDGGTVGVDHVVALIPDSLGQDVADFLESFLYLFLSSVVSKLVLQCSHDVLADDTSWLLGLNLSLRNKVSSNECCKG